MSKPRVTIEKKSNKKEMDAFEPWLNDNDLKKVSEVFRSIQERKTLMKYGNENFYESTFYKKISNLDSLNKLIQIYENMINLLTKKEDKDYIELPHKGYLDEIYYLLRGYRNEMKRNVGIQYIEGIETFKKIDGKEPIYKYRIPLNSDIFTFKERVETIHALLQILKEAYEKRKEKPMSIKDLQKQKELMKTVIQEQGEEDVLEMVPYKVVEGKKIYLNTDNMNNLSKFMRGNTLFGIEQLLVPGNYSDEYFPVRIIEGLLDEILGKENYIVLTSGPEIEREKTKDKDILKSITVRTLVMDLLGNIGYSETTGNTAIQSELTGKERAQKSLSKRRAFINAYGMFDSLKYDALEHPKTMETLEVSTYRKTKEVSENMLKTVNKGGLDAEAKMFLINQMNDLEIGEKKPLIKYMEKKEKKLIKDKGEEQLMEEEKDSIEELLKD